MPAPTNPKWQDCSETNVENAQPVWCTWCGRHMWIAKDETLPLVLRCERCKGIVILVREQPLEAQTK